jgi:hypothetical protein
VNVSAHAGKPADAAMPVDIPRLAAEGGGGCAVKGNPLGEQSAVVESVPRPNARRATS